ncbi:MAG: enoyl-CoA hydratase/isomerase family protein [Betaproteobacteria bacterium]|nr:enoyl-CoA hydratase/isomerase family protein [Betaproteobacteria bacterium]MBV9362423.1 enoyl-CoA hydratase/isomerase family protein [Betaproteobacteria bacterium]
MIDLEREGGIARIFLNRPEKVNALSASLLDSLAAEVERLAANESLRVLVLAGRGKVFCAGADVGELATLNESTAPAFVARVHRVCEALRALPVPVIAQLHGVVIGAGLEIAAACDLRIAAKGTRFAMPEVRLGIPSVVEAALLPRLMGSGRAAWLVLTGEAIDAERAYQWGLVEEVTEDLDQTVGRVVQSLVAADRRTLHVQKKLLQLWEEAPLARSVDGSLARFAEAYADGVPPALRRHTISRA